MALVNEGNGYATSPSPFQWWQLISRQFSHRALFQYSSGGTCGATGACGSSAPTAANGDVE